MLRAGIYDAVFAPLTSRWYSNVLMRLPDGAHLLDIGVGTARALTNNAALLREKRLKVTGIDIDADYLESARQRLCRAELEDVVSVKRESVYDHHDGPYDAAYFSASFMLLAEPERALRQVSNVLKADGRMFFTQTFNTTRSSLLEVAKPLLKKVTTIEFGRVTYEDEFLHTLQDSDVQLLEFVSMSSNPLHSYCLAVATPRAAAH